MSGKGKNTSQEPKSPGAIGSPFQFSAKAVSASKPKSKLETTRQKFLTLLDALNEEEIEEFREFVREELDFGTELAVSWIPSTIFPPAHFMALYPKN
jgi:hypothetical protein